MKSIAKMVNEKPWLGWALFLATLLIVVILGISTTSVLDRTGEEIREFQMITPIAPMEADSSVWGKNFVREYDTWLKTKESDFKSKYNGSAMRDMLEADPRWVVLWAGYGFAKDYNQGRGHAHTIEDTRNTLRTNSGMPGTCWTCKSTDVPRVMNKLGDIDKFYGAKWEDWIDEIKNPIGCLDCHDPKTMNLRISRPALIEYFKRTGKEINDATHQEMRSLVCAQCHVEYYFKGEHKHLTFPWDNGMTMEDMEKYYDKINFADWTHKLSRVPMVKPQHPDYELFRTGIHSQRGLACADCHMPYNAEGGLKFSNHHVTSPLKYISKTCVTCHRESEEDLTNNVYERQDKVKEATSSAVELLVHAHIEAKAAWDNGATEDEMKPAIELIRKAQWRCDFVAASHGAPFHAPLESSRILADSIKLAGQARLALAGILTKHNVAQPVALPDVSTKAKAQAYIGLDMEAERAKKAADLKKWSAK